MKPMCILVVEAICSETFRAIKALKRLSEHHTSKADPSGQWTNADVRKCNDIVRMYRRALVQVARVPEHGQPKKQRMAERLLLASFNSRVCAILRTVVRFDVYAAPGEVFKLAEQLDVWRPLDEHVLASWHPKPSGGFRLICQDGPIRTALRLLVRDMCSLMGSESEFDYSKKGAGGKNHSSAPSARQWSTIIRGGYRPTLRTVSRPYDPHTSDGYRLTVGCSRTSCSCRSVQRSR